MSVPRPPRSRFYDGRIYARVLDRLLAGLHDRVAEHVEPTSRILDVGCGTGALVFRLASKAREVVGAKLSPAMVAHARERLAERGLSNVSFVLGDVTTAFAGTEDGHFDLATMILVLHEMPDEARSSVLAEVARIARRVVCVDFHAPMPLNLAGLLNTTLSKAVPLTLGALSGILCERAGVVNIAIEGMMKFLTHYIQRTDLPFKTTGLVYGIVKGVIYVLGILIILTVLGISIAPLITALGVGGLAVALALQDTLANLFAGIHILVEKSIRVGNFVRLDSGHEGTIQDITWRTTRIRLQQNIMVVIPNSKLAQSVVTNCSLPEERTAITVQIGVDYAYDCDHVEKILMEEAKKTAGEVPGMLEDPAPVVRLDPGFGESSLD